MIITGPNPPDADTVISVSVLGRMALGVIYFIMGIAASFCCGVALGGVVGFFRALFGLFRSRTAWFACLTFLAIAYLGLSFGFSVLPLAGLLGDKTGYQMQTVLVVGAFVGLFTWMMPIAMLAIGSKELVLCQTFRPYGLVYGFLVYYVCGLLGFIMVFGFLIAKLSLGWLTASLILYPVTFVIAPFYMAFGAGIWWPLLLHFGGLFLGGFLMSLAEEKSHVV